MIAIDPMWVAPHARRTDRRLRSDQYITSVPRKYKIVTVYKERHVVCDVQNMGTKIGC